MLNGRVANLPSLEKHFREEFLRRSTSKRAHVGDPCVVCALYDILIALNNASTDAKREVVAPTSLRISLRNYYRENNFFPKVNDSFEILFVIFTCLHQGYTSSTVVFDATRGFSNPACIAHYFFLQSLNVHDEVQRSLKMT